MVQAAHPGADASAARRAGIPPAFIVIIAGMVAALHIGKIPPALPVLRDALGVSLVEAGFLLSMVQMAGMLGGVFCGSSASFSSRQRLRLPALSATHSGR